MLFHEIYGTYFQAVARILTAAVDHNVTDGEIRNLIREHAFEESSLNIPEALGGARWRLIRKDGSTVVKHKPTMPLTTLQKRWINAIALDPRIRLFTDDPVVFPDVEPLFLPEDIYIFDQYADGDPYEDETYIRNFRLILDAIRGKYPLEIGTVNRRGGRMTVHTIPEYLEYSVKDDKFRVIGSGKKLGHTINLGRIISCEKCSPASECKQGEQKLLRPRTVIFDLLDERNALERVLMHFAHFEKQVVRTGERSYQITLHYDKDDETEILIRILSFGPRIHVVKPDAFVRQIKERLEMQKRCGL
ncbi:MAG: WYL domain-containing protein [Lachnospiraceae bacterium]|nr:WYL domain-containing protein [Lachnospiraceae bacterium]